MKSHDVTTDAAPAEASSNDGAQPCAAVARLKRRDAMLAAAVVGGRVLAGGVLSSSVFASGIIAPGCAPSTVLRAQPQPEPTTGGSNVPSPATGPSALAANHVPVPLPFKASALQGLSERLISSHHENNYGGAVKNLNRVEQELTAITAETPPLVVAALRERELTFRNSKTLHEGYFGNLGGSGPASGTIAAALSQAYGSTGRWEEHFRMTGMGLGGGSGWVILGYELDAGALRTCWSGHHTQAPAGCVPLLIMDLYEHSYQLDFGAQHARYIDAFFANIHWDEVNRRFEGAQRAAAALRAPG